MDEKGISDKKLRKAVVKMKVKEDAMNNGQTKPGYNVQIATENQFITNYGLYHQANDQGTMIPFLVENMFYNKELDFYVCPMGQHLGFVKQIKEKSDLG